MAHQSRLQSEKYRQWVKAGLGLGYLKEGLGPFCDDVAKQQHKDILDNIKQTKYVPSVLCGTCTLKTLQPDHVKLGNNQCPLRYANCNCCYTAGKNKCPNNVCGAIYDNIIKYHASTPPAPNWKNTHTQQWTADPWSIAKCFINAPGYEQKTSAADTDCTGLLHVIINNKYFQNHVSCNMNIPNIFSKVRQYRNEIFHSSTMELDSVKTNSYIDDMIAVLQDSKELIHRHDSQEAVKKLQNLKKEAFIINTEDVEKVLGDIKEFLSLIKGTTEGLEKDNEDQKRKIANLESKTSELEKEVKYLRDISAKKNMDYDSSKADLKEKLLKEYRDYLLHMTAMPCHSDHECSFEDVYVSPRLNLKSKDTDTEVKTMSDIFFKEDKPFKSIYILGEAGSGKSSFCKSLIRCWCKSQSNTQNQDSQKVEKYNEDHTDLLKVMKKFNFLFFLFLRDFTHKVSINDMLEEEYEKHPVLKELLQRESETCLIVLDGLDEWTSTTKCPPKRAKFSNYTMLTTSRPWKIESLGISRNDKQQIIYLNGFDDTSRNKMISNILKILQEQYPNNKKAKDKDVSRECAKVLSKKPFYSMTHTAMMLQQLICLWFEDRLHATSRCNLYTCMLDLFFVWYKQKDPKSLQKMFEKSSGLGLPEYLNNTDECKSHSYIIRNLSLLAYETLIKNEKETSLTFDSSMFKKLYISHDIKDCCLKLGILSEERGHRLSPSSSRKSHISFFHKSFQEYFAAVHIVLNINNGQKPSLDTENADASDNLSQMLNVKTLDELLEQENVLIMLCGMDTMVAKSVCKFIYNTVAKDDRVVKYRKTIDDDIRNNLFIEHIQTFILNCAEETKARCKLHQFSFDLADLVLYWLPRKRSIIGEIEQHISLVSVMSFNTDTIKKGEYDGRILECMAKCNNLEKIQIECDFDDEVYQRICDSIEVNASTLKCLSLKRSTSTRYTFGPGEHASPFRHIANITHLVALLVDGFTLTHKGFTSLCTFLSGTGGNLQQISINIKCKCWQQHEVDLSKHKQLQYLQYSDPVVVTKVVCTNLEVIRCSSLNEIHCKQVLDLLSNSMKIKEMYLNYDLLSETSITNVLGQTDYQTTITSKLTHVISLSQQLRKLTLKGFTFIDNIITCPYEMNRLESIDITRGTLSLTTWLKFVDSVTELPQPVHVKACFMRITRDWEESNADIRWKGRGEKSAAFRYVREREALFAVHNESSISIEFSTRK